MDVLARFWLSGRRRCRTFDVLLAFKVVGEEIRAGCKRLARGKPGQAELYALAMRVKEQRELIRQVVGRHASKHVRQLIRQNRRARQRVVELANAAGRDPSLLIFR